MKIKILLFAALVSLGIFTTSCDEINPPYTLNFTVDTSKVVRKTLLEEFTGHTCPNCPKGHAIITTFLNN